MEYEQDLKRFRDYHNTISYAKMEARSERDFEFVKNSIKEGLSLEMISKLTKLSISEIKRIIQEIGQE